MWISNRKSFPQKHHFVAMAIDKIPLIIMRGDSIIMDPYRPTSRQTYRRWTLCLECRTPLNTNTHHSPLLLLLALLEARVDVDALRCQGVRHCAGQSSGAVLGTGERALVLVHRRVSVVGGRHRSLRRQRWHCRVATRGPSIRRLSRNGRDRSICKQKVQQTTDY